MHVSLHVMCFQYVSSFFCLRGRVDPSIGVLYFSCYVMVGMVYLFLHAVCVCVCARVCVVWLVHCCLLMLFGVRRAYFVFPHGRYFR